MAAGETIKRGWVENEDLRPKTQKRRPSSKSPVKEVKSTIGLPLNSQEQRIGTSYLMNYGLMA